jgi:hypothetical protein
VRDRGDEFILQPIDLLARRLGVTQANPHLLERGRELL